MMLRNNRLTLVYQTLLVCAFIEFSECGDNRPMRMTWLDMNLNCDGVCYYFNDDDTPVKKPPSEEPESGIIGPPSDDPTRCAYYPYGSDGYNATAVSKKSCRAIFSITEYIPTNCHGFNRQPLTDTLCQRNQWIDKDRPKPTPSKLYKITLAYRMKEEQTLNANPPRMTAYSCDPSRYYHRVYTVGTACYPREYIAVAFSSDAGRDNEYNPFYVCLLGEARVEGYRDHIRSWKRGKSRVSLGVPYVNAAPGVFWSTVFKPKGEDTVICSFILDEKVQPYKQTFWDGRKHHINLASTPDLFGLETWGVDTAKPVSPPPGWKVKLSFGRVERRVEPDGGMYSDVLDVPIYDRTKMAISNVFLKEKDISDRTRKPSLVGKVPVAPDPVSLAKIAKVYKACYDKKALCYHFDDEDSCIQREKCHALVVIREVPNSKFNTLHLDLVSHHKEIPGFIIPVSPFGWVAAGFSNDRKMGMDIAFSCAFMGYGNYKVFMSLNGENYINVPVFDSMIQPNPFFTNVEIVASVTGIETEPRVMCSFDIPTKFTVELSPHYLVWATLDRQRLEYDLKKKSYFILLATGGRVTSTFNLTYHGKGRGQVSEKEFSQERYHKVTGTGVTFQLPLVILIICNLLAITFL